MRLKLLLAVLLLPLLVGGLGVVVLYWHMWHAQDTMLDGIDFDLEMYRFRS